MEQYSFLRELADSWGLLVLFVFFIGMIVWVFRPGSRASHEDSASIPLRHEDRPPAPDEDAKAAAKEART
ncbi:MAG: cbb3-type cytochrome c oxidase subunit 3 [Rhodobacteraceae bacterium]|nr:MAG: cbb3-type cytochrome c oxidase subunit 3 [Paracoccaceae bacterium]